MGGRRKKKEERPDTAAAKAVPGAATDGQMLIQMPMKAEPSLDEIRTRAVQWAKECGLKPPFCVSGPERVDYPQRGHGYAVQIREERPDMDNAKCRLGTARFTADGEPAMWTIDGITGV